MEENPQLTNFEQKANALLTEKSFSLDEIISSEENVFIDNGLEQQQGGNWYREHVYKPSYFSELDTNNLFSVRGNVSEFLEIIGSSSIYVCPLVLEEMKVMREIIGDKLRALNKSELWKQKLQKKKKKSYKHHVKNTDVNKNLLEEIQHSYYLVCKTASHSLFVPEDKGIFNLFERVVSDVTHNLPVKRDFSRRYGIMGENYERNGYADEQIAASALYKHIIDSSSCCIVTKDSDIYRTLIITQKHLLIYSSINDKFLQSFKENPIKVYFKVLDNYKLFPDIISLGQETLLTIPEVPINAAEELGKNINTLSQKIIDYK